MLRSPLLIQTTSLPELLSTAPSLNVNCNNPRQLVLIIVITIIIIIIVH